MTSTSPPRRDPADLNWNSPHAAPVGPPSMGGPHFLGAEGCIWGESVWPSTLDSLVWPRASPSGAHDRASPNFMGLTSLGCGIGIFCDSRNRAFVFNAILGLDCLGRAHRCVGAGRAALAAGQGLRARAGEERRGWPWTLK
jgi:hypothetical protein